MRGCSAPPYLMIFAVSLWLLTIILTNQYCKYFASPHSTKVMSGYHPRDDIDQEPEDSDNSDGAIEYGILQSCISTNYNHHNSSSPTPLQMMTQEVCFNIAKNYLLHSLIIARLIACLLKVYKLLSTRLSTYYHVVSENITLQALREKVTIIAKRLQFILKGTRAHSELALIYAEDLAVFICCHHWFEPKCFRKLH